MKSLLRSLLGFFIALIGILLLIEVVLWLAHRQSPEPRIIQTMKQSEPGVKSEIVFEQNGLGLRGKTFSEIEKTPKTVRILVLGGSFAKLPLQSWEDTWLAKLETALNVEWQTKGWKAEVASFGDMQSTTHALSRWYRFIGHTYKPDVVVTCTGIDDHVALGVSNEISSVLSGAKLVEAANSPYRSNRSLLISPVFLAKYSQIYRHYRSVNAQSQTARSLAQSHGQNILVTFLAEWRQRYAQTPVIAASDLHSEERKAAFSLVTDDLFQNIVASGALLVTLGAPTLQHEDMTPEEQAKVWMRFIVVDKARSTNIGGKLNPGDFQLALRGFNEILQQKATAAGGLYVDLPHLLPPTAENFVDDAMPTDVGNARIAEILQTTLVKPLTDKFVK